MTKTCIRHSTKQVGPVKHRKKAVHFTSDTDHNPRGKATTKTGVRQQPGTTDKRFVGLVKLKKMLAKNPAFKQHMPEKVRGWMTQLRKSETNHAQDLDLTTLAFATSQVVQSDVIN